MKIRILFYFLIYAFLGWIIDTSYRSYIAGEFTHNSITIWPLTPIYGLGALLILAIHSKIKQYPIWALFIIYSIVLSAYEYIGGVFTVIVFNKRLWDYSDSAYNLHGHTDLRHLIIWGILAIVLVKLVHPQIKRLGERFKV